MADQIESVGISTWMTIRTSPEDPGVDMPPQGDEHQNAGTLGPDLQAHIGRQLRSMYDEVLKEPVPDRLRELLRQLEQKPPGSHD